MPAVWEFMKARRHPREIGEEPYEGAMQAAGKVPRVCVVRVRRTLEKEVGQAGLRPGTTGEAAQSPVGKKTTQEQVQEAPIPAKPPRGRGSRSATPENREVEVVSTMEISELSRPTTPGGRDTEMVSSDLGAEPSRDSSSSDTVIRRKLTAPKRKRTSAFQSSPEAENAAEAHDSPRGRLKTDQRKEIDSRLKGIELLSSSDMAALAMEWLQETEDCRMKSGNIKGSLNKKIKVNVSSVAGVIKILAMRTAAEGDIGFLRSKLMELQKEVTGLKEENEQLKLQVQDLRSGALIREAPARADKPGPVKSPGALLVSPAPLRELMEASINSDMGLLSGVADRASLRAQQFPAPSGVENILGEAFFDRMAATISGAMESALRTQLLALGALGDGMQGRERPRDIRESLKRMEGQDLSSVEPGPLAPDTEEDGPLRPAVSARKKKEKHRATREEAASQPISGENKAERLRELADYPPLPVPRGNVPAPPNGPKSDANQKRDEGAAKMTARNRMHRAAPKTPKRRAPRSSAVTLVCPESGPTYSEAIREAKKHIVLEDLGIADTRMRSTVSGNILIEIPGADTSRAADALATRLRDAFRDTGVRVGRPTIRGELRLSGLDGSILPEELVEEVASVGKCARDQVRLGAMRLARNGLRTIWLQCPLDAAISLAESGKIRVGWSTAKVELLKRRPLQCFRCLAVGHVRERCPSDVDRTSNCFNCGEPGHVARECGKPTCCPVCKERGLPSAHRAGADTCPPCPPKREPARSPRRGKTRVDRSERATEMEVG
ncbi:PREDICTED: uncharacterized protein LOC105449524 [Wasmannia auropunctata]|uniref:uncharacterized protein LOC105449524 n=1 Tax=Wasmannia auropunctata TaxID=64793 RepID=UPI0005EF532E|nr:PREDICTED: uncharacterized protein LOC105449524 [Wasmannia auropunctata]